MSRKTILAGLLTAGVIAGAAPALAAGNNGHVCLAATRDKNNPGPSVICVWSPMGVATSPR